MTETIFVYCVMHSAEDPDGYRHSEVMTIHSTLEGATKEIKEVYREATIEQEKDKQLVLEGRRNNYTITKLLDDVRTEEYEEFLCDICVLYILKKPLLE